MLCKEFINPWGFSIYKIGFNIKVAISSKGIIIVYIKNHNIKILFKMINYSKKFIFKYKEKEVEL